STARRRSPPLAAAATRITHRRGASSAAGEWQVANGGVGRARFAGAGHLKPGAADGGAGSGQGQSNGSAIARRPGRRRDRTGPLAVALHQRARDGTGRLLVEAQAFQELVHMPEGVDARDGFLTEIAALHEADGAIVAVDLLGKVFVGDILAVDRCSRFN